jgi:hypothetical protein
MFELSQLSRVDMQYAPIEMPDSTIGIFGKHIIKGKFEHGKNMISSAVL